MERLQNTTRGKQLKGVNAAMNTMGRAQRATGE